MKSAAAGCCAICRRAEQGAGYTAPGKQRVFRVTWACETDIELAGTVHKMKTDSLQRIERQALDAAGEKAGAFLDGLGRTDLGELTPEEWRAFLTTVLDEFGNEMRTRLGAK